jgi:hypothetical protein
MAEEPFTCFSCGIKGTKERQDLDRDAKETWFNLVIQWSDPPLARHFTRKLDDGTLECRCDDCADKVKRQFFPYHVDRSGILGEVIESYCELYHDMLLEAIDHEHGEDSKNAREMFPTVPVPTPCKRRVEQEEKNLIELLARIGKPVVFPILFERDDDEQDLFTVFSVGNGNPLTRRGRSCLRWPCSRTQSAPSITTITGVPLPAGKHADRSSDRQPLPGANR